MAQIHQTAHEDLDVCRDTRVRGGSRPPCRGRSPLLTSLVLRSKRLEVPGVLQGLHLLADSAAEQADEVQAMQLEF